MKWTFIFEFDASEDEAKKCQEWPWWKPGIFKSTLGGRPYRRIWWFCFALAWWKGNSKEYGEVMKNAEWRYENY